MTIPQRRRQQPTGTNEVIACLSSSFHDCRFGATGVFPTPRIHSTPVLEFDPARNNPPSDRRLALTMGCMGSKPRWFKRQAPSAAPATSPAQPAPSSTPTPSSPPTSPSKSTPSAPATSPSHPAPSSWHPTSPPKSTLSTGSTHYYNSYGGYKRPGGGRKGGGIGGGGYSGGAVGGSSG